MKQSKMRILCLLLSLTACGKDKKEENSNVMKFDDCELVYKSACIMDDFDGNDAACCNAGLYQYQQFK